MEEMEKLDAPGLQLLQELLEQALQDAKDLHDSKKRAKFKARRAEKAARRGRALDADNDVLNYSEEAEEILKEHHARGGNATAAPHVPEGNAAPAPHVAEALPSGRVQGCGSMPPAHQPTSHAGRA